MRGELEVYLVVVWQCFDDPKMEVTHVGKSSASSCAVFLSQSK